MMPRIVRFWNGCTPDLCRKEVTENAGKEVQHLYLWKRRFNTFTYGKGGLIPLSSEKRDLTPLPHWKGSLTILSHGEGIYKE